MRPRHKLTVKQTELYKNQNGVALMTSKTHTATVAGECGKVFKFTCKPLHFKPFWLNKCLRLSNLASHALFCDAMKVWCMICGVTLYANQCVLGHFYYKMAFTPTPPCSSCLALWRNCLHVYRPSLGLFPLALPQMTSAWLYRSINWHLLTVNAYRYNCV